MRVEIFPIVKVDRRDKTPRKNRKIGTKMADHRDIIYQKVRDFRQTPVFPRRRLWLDRGFRGGFGRLPQRDAATSSNNTENLTKKKLRTTWKLGIFRETWFINIDDSARKLYDVRVVWQSF